MKYSG